MVATRTGARHEIGREMSIKAPPRRLIGGDSAEADEAVRPHKDGAATITTRR